MLVHTKLTFIMYIKNSTIFIAKKSVGKAQYAASALQPIDYHDKTSVPNLFILTVLMTT